MAGLRIAPIVLSGIAGALAVIIAALAAGWFSVGQISAQDEVSADVKVEVMAAALAVSRHSGTMATAVSATTHGGMTAENLQESAAAVSEHKDALAQQLEILAGKGYDGRVVSIEDLVNQLVSNAEMIEQGRPRLLRAIANSETNRRQLSVANTASLFPAAAASVDGQFYRMMTQGPRWRAEQESAPEQGTAEAQHSEPENSGFRRPFHNEALGYSHIAALQADLLLGHTLLSIASLMQDPVLVARIQETYDSTAERMGRSITYLSANRGPDLAPQVIPGARRLLAAGSGANNYFDLLENRLDLTVAEKALIAENGKILNRLMAEIDGLAAEVQGLSAPAIPETEEDAGDPGVTGDEIRFGQSAALTGPSGALGEGMRLGIEAAFHEANQDGGVHGRELKLTTLDDRYETDFAFRLTQRLIEEEQVFGLIGAVGTPTSRAASPLARAAGVPFVAPFTGAEFLRDSELSNTLNLRASYYQETEEMVKRLTHDMGITRVAVLYQNDSYGQNGLAGVRRALARRGLEPVASWFYHRNTSAVKSAVLRIADAEPEAVIIIGSYAPAARTIELLRLEADPIFMAVSFVGSNALADELGDAGEGVYVTQVVPLPDDESVPVVARYLEALSAYRPNSTPGFVSLEGYLAGRLAIAGLEACGEDVSRECFLDAVQNSESIDIDGLQLKYGPDDNQGSDAVFLTVIGEDGKYRQVE